MKLLKVGQVAERLQLSKSKVYELVASGKPTDNAYIESFNGRFRQECLNQHWFLSLEDAREKVERWRIDYIQERPHSALGNETPQKFATSARTRQTGAVPFPSALARPQHRVQAEATATANGTQDKP